MVSFSRHPGKDGHSSSCAAPVRSAMDGGVAAAPRQQGTGGEDDARAGERQPHEEVPRGKRRGEAARQIVPVPPLECVDEGEAEAARSAAGIPIAAPRRTSRKLPRRTTAQTVTAPHRADECGRPPLTADGHGGFSDPPRRRSADGEASEAANLTGLAPSGRVLQGPSSSRTARTNDGARGSERASCGWHGCSSRAAPPQVGDEQRDDRDEIELSEQHLQHNYGPADPRNNR